MKNGARRGDRHLVNRRFVVKRQIRRPRFHYRGAATSVATLMVSMIFACRLQAENPDQTLKIIEAPSGNYSIVQAWSTEAEHYQTTVHFNDQSKPDKAFPPETFENNDESADYVISPNERWFIRDQRLGSGTNILVLYELTPTGEVKQIRSDLRDLGLDCVMADLRRKDKKWADINGDFDHVSAENVLWNATSEVLTFDVSARTWLAEGNQKFKRYKTIGAFWKKYPPIYGRTVDYDLRTAKVRMHSGRRKIFDASLAASSTGKVTTRFAQAAPAIYARWQCNAWLYQVRQHPNDGADQWAQPVTVRAVWRADGSAASRGSKFRHDTETVTSRPDDFGSFVLSRPKRGWTSHNYYVEFYIDDNLIETIQFRIS